MTTPTAIPQGTHILLGAVSPNELYQLKNVFMPVDGMQHLDHLWNGYRRVKAAGLPSPGLHTHLTVQFVDPNVEDRQYNISNDTYMAVVVSDTGAPISFAPGIRILAGALTAAEIIRLDTNVFLPVGTVERDGTKWEKIALTERFHIEGNQITFDFATPDVKSLTFRPDQLSNVMLVVWETGQVIAGLIQQQ